MKNYVKMVHELVDKLISASNEINAELAENAEKLKNGRIAPVEHEARKKELNHNIEIVRQATIAELNEYCREYATEVDTEAVNNSDISNKDAELFKADIPLNQTQFYILAEKYKNNEAMLKLMSGYADKHNLAFGYVSADAKKATFNDFVESAKAVLRNPHGMHAGYFFDGKLDPNTEE